MSNNFLEVNDGYLVAPAALDDLRKALPWGQMPQYWANCAINLSAAEQMLRHAVEGIHEGQTSSTGSGKSFEILGLLLGYADPSTGTLVVVQSIPLPVYGIETSVNSASLEMQALLAELTEIISTIHPLYRIIGWYHSHPFDLAPHSHCHLSLTDVMTQLDFQAISPWWIALVIDPFRSLSQKSFEFGVYRCYPADSVNPEPLRLPNGVITNSHGLTAAVTRWGSQHANYYQLYSYYFISSLNARSLSLLCQHTKLQHQQLNSSSGGSSSGSSGSGSTNDPNEQPSNTFFNESSLKSNWSQLFFAASGLDNLPQLESATALAARQMHTMATLDPAHTLPATTPVPSDIHADALTQAQAFNYLNQSKIHAKILNQCLTDRQQYRTMLSIPPYGFPTAEASQPQSSDGQEVGYQQQPLLLQQHQQQQQHHHHQQQQQESQRQKEQEKIQLSAFPSMHIVDWSTKLAHNALQEQLQQQQQQQREQQPQDPVPQPHLEQNRNPLEAQFGTADFKLAKMRIASRPDNHQFPAPESKKVDFEDLEESVQVILAAVDAESTNSPAAHETCCLSITTGYHPALKLWLEKLAFPQK